MFEVLRKESDEALFRDMTYSIVAEFVNSAKVQAKIREGEKILRVEPAMEQAVAARRDSYPPRRFMPARI